MDPRPPDAPSPTANIYNNLFDALLQPLRLMGVAKRESYKESDEWGEQ